MYENAQTLTEINYTIVGLLEALSNTKKSTNSNHKEPTNKNYIKYKPYRNKL